MTQPSESRPVKWCKRCGEETERFPSGGCRPCGLAAGKRYRARRAGTPKPPKWCKACGEVTRRWKDGRCAPCGIEESRAFRRDNPERSRAIVKKYQDANVAAGRERVRAWREQNRERSRAWDREWRAKNPDAAKAKRDRYAAAHPDRVKEQQRASRQRHPESGREAVRRRRARMSDALVHDVPDAMVWEFNPAGPGCCNYCRKALTLDERGAWDIDHVVPLSRGGLHELQNLVIACVRCNRSKGAKMLSEWVAPLDAAA